MQRKSVPPSAQDMLCLSGCPAYLEPGRLGHSLPKTQLIHKEKIPTCPSQSKCIPGMLESASRLALPSTMLLVWNLDFSPEERNFTMHFLHQVKVWTSLPWQSLCNIQFLWVPEESSWNTNVLWFFRCILQASQTYFYWYLIATSFAKYSYQIYWRLFLSDINVGNPFCWDTALIMLVPRSPCP